MKFSFKNFFFSEQVIIIGASLGCFKFDTRFEMSSLLNGYLSEINASFSMLII